MVQKRSKDRKLTLPILVFLVLGVSHARARGQAQTGLRGAKADLAFTYDATRATRLDHGGFWLQGGAVELHVPFYRGMGMVATVGGAHSGSDNPLIAPLDLVTAVFGPRYTITSRGGRASAFAQALGGEAHGFNSVFPRGSGPVSNPANGTSDRAYSAAFQAGVGVDVGVSRTVAFRVIQIDYLRTQLPNGGTNLQNNVRLGVGLVLRFRP